MPGEVYGAERIKELLPYRYPMLMLDRIWSESETKFVGLKNITANEPVFMGHFPAHPIMPGVLQIESMQQVAIIATQKQLDPAGTGDIHIKMMRNVKFRRPANPGDRLLIEITVDKIENGTAEITAVNRINAGVACQARLTLGVRPRIRPTLGPVVFDQNDKTDKILMDVNKIREYIPHRFPFLLIDYILSIDGPNVVAVKNVTFNEPYMANIYPDYAVMPGSIQAEIIAQAGCVHTLARPENAGKTPYYMGLVKAEYIHPIHPGDQLRIEVVLPKAGSRFGRGDGQIVVDGRVVSKAEMTFALIDSSQVLGDETAPAANQQ